MTSRPRRSIVCGFGFHAGRARGERHERHRERHEDRLGRAPGAARAEPDAFEQILLDERAERLPAPVGRPHVEKHDDRHEPEEVEHIDVADVHNVSPGPAGIAPPAAGRGPAAGRHGILRKIVFASATSASITQSAAIAKLAKSSL